MRCWRWWAAFFSWSFRPRRWGVSWSRSRNNELSEDPRDLVASFLREKAQHFGDARFFGAVYLLSHGVSKIVLVVEIFRGRLWAYPAMLVLLGAFIVYQSYRLVHAFTVGMVALTLFDMIVAWLTCREYGRQREHLSARRK
jgi:uncharacterized membrane protein